MTTDPLKQVRELYAEQAELPDLTEIDAWRIVIGQRHADTQHVVQFFHYDQLPEGLLRETSFMFAQLMQQLVLSLPDGPELVECLRELLKAKDCAVRHASIAYAEPEDLPE